MTENKTDASGTAPLPEPRPKPAKVRRVGTFTFGVALVATGLGMLAALFFPGLDLTVLLKLSPALLILLGGEVILSARKSEKLRYDWLGMLFCFFVVCGALCAFAAAWVLLHYPEHVFYW